MAWLARWATSRFSSAPAPLAEAAPCDDRYVGFVDRLAHRQLIGWAFDRKNPNYPVLVEAVSETGRRSVATACIYRDDVRAAGHGNGCYGFDLDLSHSDFDIGPIIVRFAESGALVCRRPLQLDVYRDLMDSELPPGFVAIVQRLAIQTEMTYGGERGPSKGVGR